MNRRWTDPATLSYNFPFAISEPTQTTNSITENAMQPISLSLYA